MNQQSSKTNKEPQLIQNREKDQDQHLVDDELIYQEGQILSAKHQNYNQSLLDQTKQINQQLDKNVSLNKQNQQNLTSPDYHQQTQALESSMCLNNYGHDTQNSCQIKPFQEEIQNKKVIKNQIISSDMRSRLKNRNNARLNQQQQQQQNQQQQQSRQQQATMNTSLSPNKTSNQSNYQSQDVFQNNQDFKGIKEESDKILRSQIRKTSSKEIDSEWKSPLAGFQNQNNSRNFDEILTVSQKMKKSKRVNSKEDFGLQRDRGKRQDSFANLNGGNSTFNQIPEDFNMKGGFFSRDDNKKGTIISGGSRIHQDKMRISVNTKQLNVPSQQSIGTDDNFKNLTLQVPHAKQHNQKDAGFNNQQSPRSKQFLANQTKSVSQSSLHKDSPSKMNQTKGGFFQFFSNLLKISKKGTQNTPLNKVNPAPNMMLQSQHYSNPASNIFQNQNNSNIVMSQLINNPNVNTSQANIPAEINPGTNWNFVKKLAKVKKFIDSIKISSLYQSFYKVKKSHLDLIGDSSDYNVVIENINQKTYNSMYLTEAELKKLRKSHQRKFYKSFLLWIENLSQYIPLFLPHQPLINWFKVILLFISIITLVYVPLKGSFDLVVGSNSPEFYLIFLIPFLMYISEILVAFNTAYYEEGDIQMNRIKIIQQYLKTMFFVDLITTVSLYFLYAQQKLYFAILVMFKIFRIGAYRRDINEYFYIQQRSNTLYTLVNLIITVILVAHYFACGFNYIAVIEEDYYNASSWVKDLNIDNQWISRYINAIYFSFITMVTVGFGDIKPTTDPEKVYVTLVALISSLIFAYTVNTIGTVFQEIAQQEAEYKAQKYHLSIYMRSRGINQQLQTRVMKYLDHMIHKQLESPEKGQEILKKMSKKIRDEIYKDFYGKILQNSKMFKFNFSENFLKDLTVQMKEIICRPGEIIFTLNECDNRIFFINKGEVQLFLEKYKRKDEQDNYSYDILTKGDIFGEQSFFTSKLRETSAKSLSVSHLIYCTYDDFVQVLKQFPKDHEKFCQMKDEILNYGEQLNTKCTACQKFRHSIFNCPYVHLKTRRENVIHRHIRSIPNERGKPENDRRKLKTNALKICQKVKIKLRKLRKMYISKQNKKMKDEENIQLDDNKAGYLINVKKTYEDEESSDSVISEKPIELRKISDKKFFQTNPRLFLDQFGQICIQNEDDEQYDDNQEEEEDEFQDDSRDIQMLEDEDDGIIEDDIDESSNNEEESDYNQDSIYSSENSQSEQNENSNTESDQESNSDEKDELVNNKKREDSYNNPLHLTKRDSIFKAQDQEKRRISSVSQRWIANSNLERQRERHTSIDLDAQQQKLQQKKKASQNFNPKEFVRKQNKHQTVKIKGFQSSKQQQDSAGEFERKERKNISKTLPNPQSVSGNNYKTQYAQQQYGQDKYKNDNLKNNQKMNNNLNISPDSPSSTAIRSNQTSNVNIQNDYISEFQAKINVTQTMTPRDKQREINAHQLKIIENVDNVNQTNFYSTLNSNNHSKATSITEPITYSINVNQHYSKTNSNDQQGLAKQQSLYQEQLYKEKRNLIPSIESNALKILEDPNEIISLSLISKSDNTKGTFENLQEKELSENDLKGGGQQSSLGEIEGQKNINKNQAQIIKESNPNKQNNLQLSSVYQCDTQKEDQNSKSQENSNDLNKEDKALKAQNSLDNSQNSKTQNYKEQNKLMFKGSIFSLKIAGLSNKNHQNQQNQKQNKDENINEAENQDTQNKKQTTQNSQFSLESCEGLDELNNSQNNISISPKQIPQKEKEQKQKSGRKGSTKNIEVALRRRSKKELDKFEKITNDQLNQSQKDIIKQIKSNDDKKSKKRNSSNTNKIHQISLKNNPLQEQEGNENEINKNDKSTDSVHSSNNSSPKNKPTFERKDSIFAKNNNVNLKDVQSILKRKKSINLFINTQDISQGQVQVLKTPQTATNKLPFQRKQTNKSETPRNQSIKQSNEIEQEFLNQEKHKRKDKKARILTTIISPTLESQKQQKINANFGQMLGVSKNSGNFLVPKSQGNLFMPQSSNLIVPMSSSNFIQHTNSSRLPQDSVLEDKDRKIPLKKKVTNISDHSNNHVEVLQIPIPQSIQINSSPNTGASNNTNPYGISINKNYQMGQNSQFNQNTSQQNQYLKQLSFKNQMDFSSAWMQVQQQQQQPSIQSSQKSNNLLQVPNKISFTFQNGEIMQANQNSQQQSIQTPQQQQQQQSQQQQQQQSSPHHTFQNQLSINQYLNNNSQLFNLSTNPINPQSHSSQLKQFNHQQSLNLMANQPSQQGLSLQSNNQIQNQQQAQQINSARGDQQQSANQAQNQSSLQNIQFQNFQQLQQSFPMNMQNMQMNMMMLPQSNNNLLVQPSNTNFAESYYDNNNTRNQDYYSQKTLFLYDFDKMKEFTNYFPHNNYTLVCKEKKRVVNRKNYFVNKKMGNSTRNIMQSKNPLPHPSPRGNIMMNNFNTSFRGALNRNERVISTQGNNGSLNNIPNSNNASIIKDNQNDLHTSGSFGDKLKHKLKKATEQLINSKRNSGRSNTKQRTKGGDVLVVSNFNTHAPRNSSFFQISNINLDAEEKKNIDGSSVEIQKDENKLRTNSLQLDSKISDTPKAEEIDHNDTNINDEQQLKKQSAENNIMISNFDFINKTQSEQFNYKQKTNSIVIEQSEMTNKDS
ncbi:cation channel family protein (macronuclear) [Tetrahymena thermophila SB210]|uniref:Cation channel family protein n=1 Tax=Tetrahymena thermophila (strain SB210) TaxID=312017 RepID=Q234L0_TETTS|nr:cation channel family protein [Tetrahymena thermophila SB210]EAR91993.2 cation channel family protein [Tetrahymena thermophila SB210]|eukprot:XP_001012238.2 cation channel family protein [Tetrahymena thermophila SB210]